MAAQQSDERKALIEATNTRLAVAERAVNASAMALASQGVDKEQFGLVIREALLNNPDVVKAGERSLAQAVRKCCRDMIIPDGDRGAMVVFGGEAVAMPMVAGLKQMFIEETGGEIRSGVVYEGDDVRVVEGIRPDIEIVSRGTDIFKQRKGASVIGAWCWLKFPWEEFARLVLYSLDDINRSAAASRAKNGPWKVWKDRMADKSCVKSAIWRHRAEIRARGKGGRLLRVIDEDNKAEFGETQVEDSPTVIEGSAHEIEVQEVQQGQAAAEAVEQHETQKTGAKKPAGGKTKGKTNPAPGDAAAAAAQTTNPRLDPSKNPPASDMPDIPEDMRRQEGGQQAAPTGDPDDPGPSEDDDGFLPLGQEKSAFDEDDTKL